MTTETIVLAGGCFWCTEAVFDRLRGVLDVESGYANGHVEHPSYEAVCTGDTGHAEVVKLTYDPAQISLQDVLMVFFSTHDPTTLNRQGNDVGPQYRSGIYFTTPEQEATAREMVAQLEAEKIFRAPVVTEVKALESYWPAEDYHQDYFANNPGTGYCAFVVGPKVEKFSERFKALLK